MSKSLVLLFLFFALVNTVSAQSQMEISGQVKDAKTKEILEFCTISAFNLKDSAMSSTATDEKGFFTVSLEKGRYRFVIHFMGYTPDTIPALDIIENKFFRIRHIINNDDLKIILKKFYNGVRTDVA